MLPKPITAKKRCLRCASIDFDLILSDVMMPCMDGFELCRRIKQNSNTRLVPVVMLTALDDIPSKVKAIESGADDFMNKPPNQIELCARIKSLVHLKRVNSKMTSIHNVIFSLANAVESQRTVTPKGILIGFQI